MIQLFIENGHAVDGLMMHRADGRAVQVRIVHRLEDGYRLSYDGETIKEQLPLPDFIQRLAEIQYKNTAMNRPISDYVDRSVREVLSALHQGGSRLSAIAENLDKMYADYIKSGKAVLMEHTHSINVRRVDPRQWDKERVMREMDEMGVKIKPMTPDEAFRVSDTEVYYLLT